MTAGHRIADSGVCIQYESNHENNGHFASVGKSGLVDLFLG